MLYMKKRGMIVMAAGISMLVASFAVAVSLLDQGGFDRDFSIPELLEGMFDHVTENAQIRPGETRSFSFYTYDGTKQVLWGLQILDYRSGDNVVVSVSNIYGDDFGVFTSDQPAFFHTVNLERGDDLNFSVENKGSRTITAVMMFTINPEDQNRVVDPNSPLGRALVPLATVGFLLIAGIIVIVAGIVITLVDYKKRQNSEFI